MMRQGQDESFVSETQKDQLKVLINKRLATINSSF